MKDSKTNAFIAITALVAAVLMCLALSFAIGKWSWGTTANTFVIKFPNATGITPNSEVKFAGAHAGRVKEIRLIPRKDQDEDPHTHLFNCVEVVVEVDKTLELGNDVVPTIKQDGFGIAAKYVLLTPGPDHNSPDLADNAVLQGEMPFDLSDLIQPAGEALNQAKVLVAELEPALKQVGPMMDKLGPMLDRLDDITTRVQPLVGHADKLVLDGDAVLGNFNSPEGRQRLETMLNSLEVASQNLKVVSYNAKALTATLASKPWRVFWGGSTVTPPSESQDLKTDRVIRLKPNPSPKEPATVSNPTSQP